jgi:hypothetical protein
MYCVAAVAVCARLEGVRDAVGPSVRCVACSVEARLPRDLDIRIGVHRRRPSSPASCVPALRGRIIDGNVVLSALPTAQTSVHSDRGPRAWGSEGFARCDQQQQHLQIFFRNTHDSRVLNSGYGYSLSENLTLGLKYW